MPLRDPSERHVNIPWPARDRGRGQRTAARPVRGADPSRASAAVTLIKGDLQGIVRRGASAGPRIRQNLFFAFVFNALAVPIAAGVLYPALGWLPNPMIASAATSMSSVPVVTNAFRL